MGLLSDLLRRRAGTQGETGGDRVRRELDAFAEACLVHAETPEVAEPHSRYGFLLFFTGAARYAGVQHRLSEAEITGLTGELLLAVGATRAEMLSVLEDVGSSGFKPPGEEALREGAMTFREWQQGADNAAPMRLEQLLHQWL